MVLRTKTTLCTWLSVATGAMAITWPWKVRPGKARAFRRTGCPTRTAPISFSGTAISATAVDQRPRLNDPEGATRRLRIAIVGEDGVDRGRVDPVLRRSSDERRRDDEKQPERSSV